MLSKGHNKSKVVEKKKWNLNYLEDNDKISLEEMEDEVKEQIT